MFKVGGYQKLGDDIYLFSNFISDDMCDLICKDAESIKPDKWKKFHFQRYASTVAGSVHIKAVRDKISSILDEGYLLGEGLSVHKMHRNSYFTSHSDDYEFADVIKAADAYVQGDPFDLVKSNAFGVVVYLNNFEGGEIEYQNQGVVYKPVKGDLVIHGAHENCKHQVNKVLSEVRYSYPNNISEMLKVPKGYSDVA